MARRRLTIDNEVATELAGSGDAVLRELEDRLDCDVYLRGNVITLDGSDEAVEEGQALVEELLGLIERGHGIEPETVAAVDGARDSGIEPAAMLGDSIWR
ncbi:MAG: PhoH family protein, partial [Thermoleophilia bacterium]|nr:PhoH family protein [Thermoleophilia bacterium]